MVKLRTMVVIATLFCFQLVQSQNALGIRIGEPSGFTYKIYGEGSALEFILGKSHIATGENYYNKRFNAWYKKNDFEYYYYAYNQYSSSNALTLQARYLIQNPLKQFGDYTVKGLDLYYGAGAGLRYQEIDFVYAYREFNGGVLISDNKSITDLDIGVDAIVGIEYKFEDVPINVFLEFSMFVELIDNPFTFWVQGGFGGRYLF